MHDSLDLGSLKSQIIAEKKAARRTWAVMGVITLAVTMLVIFVITLALPVLRQNSDQCLTCTRTIVNFVFFTILVVMIWASLMAFSINRRRRLKQTNKLRQNLSFHELTLLPAIKTYENIFVTGSTVFIFGLGLILRLDFGIVIILFFAFLLSYIVMVMIASFWILAPIANTNYAESIRRAQLVGRWLKGNIGIMSLEGLALIYQGNSVDSEKLHLQLIAQSQKLKLYDWLAYNNYATELLYQQRFDEALPLFERAILLQPQIPNAYDGLASWYLSQNISPERSLEIANFGLQFPALKTTGMKDHYTGVKLAVLAWAEAHSGNKSLAEETLAKAFKSADKRHHPTYAETHRLAGETNLALDDLPAARDHFQKAVQLDPHGRIGKLAQQALDKIA